uniref:BRCA1-associated protein n=1 Tax=Clastoptera arizonana TaxID=38151 RepID=A0A1B6CU37_9HEMI
MSTAVSVCIFRFEICHNTNLCLQFKSNSSVANDNKQMASSKNKAKLKRDIKEYSIETYTRVGERFMELIPGSSRQDDSSLSTAKVSVSCETEDTKQSSKVFEQIPFISGNPFVETTKGILHLYKENELTTVKNAVVRSQTVCILAVPSSMTCHDLLTFLAACLDDIKNVRIIRDGSPNQYMVLLAFRTQESAAEFYSSFNGVPFNSLEPINCCSVVFVSQVETVLSGDHKPPLLHTELPTCPVCLERMDESVDGILTILCNHSFHGNCLSKWGDSTCPVCRYVQTPEAVADNHCLECNSTESLWICLICGHVGCGRYVQGHAYNHYIETQHCYSMQLENNRVWDYVGDNFVHRLLQNKSDGKLVEGHSPGKEDSYEKIDSMQLEFTYLLTSQLDSQKKYYEEMVNKFEKQMNDDTEQIKEKLIETINDNEGLQNKVAALTRDKQNLEKKLQQLINRLNQTQEDLNEEKQINKAMQENQTVWFEKYSSLEDKFLKFKLEKK